MVRPQVDGLVVRLVGVSVIAGVAAGAGHWPGRGCGQELAALWALGAVLGSRRRLSQGVLQVRDVAAEPAVLKFTVSDLRPS